jgi:hypothetical protein
MSRPDKQRFGGAPASALGAIFLLIAGPTVWAAHFLLIYGPQSALCALAPRYLPELRAWHVTALVVLVTLAALAALSIALRSPSRTTDILRIAKPSSPTGDFLIATARLLTTLSLVAVVWEGSVALMLDSCGNLRTSRSSILPSDLLRDVARDHEVEMGAATVLVDGDLAL